MMSLKGLLKNKSDKVSSSKKNSVLSSASFPGSSAVLGFDDDYESPPSSPPGKARQRNSIALGRGSTSFMGLSDYDSEDDVPKASIINPKSSGGPEHRPLVGGFAVSAYEAARADYYRKQGIHVKGHDDERAKEGRPMFRRYI